MKLAILITFTIAVWIFAVYRFIRSRMEDERRYAEFRRNLKESRRWPIIKATVMPEREKTEALRKFASDPQRTMTISILFLIIAAVYAATGLFWIRQGELVAGSIMLVNAVVMAVNSYMKAVMSKRNNEP